jgi:diguanylate cyclase (GGDEF)-like protein
MNSPNDCGKRELGRVPGVERSSFPRRKSILADELKPGILMQTGLDEIWLEKLQRRTGLDRDKSRRLYRAILVCAIGFSYLIDTIMYGLFTLAGTIEAWVVGVYGAAGLGHVVLFSLIHWFGDVERREDSQLVAWQMGYALLVQILGMSLAPQLAPVFIGTMSIVFAFGSLRIELRTALLSWFIAFVGIGVVLAFPMHRSLGIVNPSRIEVVLLSFSFALIALRTTLLGYYGSAMRMRLYKVNWALGRAKLDAEQLAASDSLTGAMSRRAILPLIEKSVKRAVRTGIPACVAMIDLDWFKSINDRFGHLAGDQVLRRVVDRIRECLRESDAIGRYGGEEFVLLLQGADQQVGARLVERVRGAVSAADWSDIGAGLKVSVSCGIACVRPTDTLDGVLARADKALYEAKRGGRDQLRVA